MRMLPARYVFSGQQMAGGMGNVAVCGDSTLERPVAIKFINSVQNRHRMDDEVAALLKLRSKHVVQIYDVIHLPNGELGIVQEYIHGQDLVESFAKPYSVADYYKQLWQIASGLTDIHALGVIHRDIKPNNMKTDPEKVIKIFDFGLARDDGAAAKTSGFVGTRGFAAPELYSHPFTFTNAVDTYAFGATALFLATGSLPGELMNQPPTFSVVDNFYNIPFNIAASLANLLNASINEDPALRPKMSEIRDELARNILFDKHRALVVFQSNTSVLSSTNKSVKLAFGTVGSIEISYTGHSFVVVGVAGEVQINNQQITAGSSLPGACVIALGAPFRRTNERRFITFDISHPEMVL